MFSKDKLQNNYAAIPSIKWAEVPASGFWLLKNASFAIWTLCHDKNPWDKIHVNWHVMIWCPEMTHSCTSFKFLRNLIKWCHIQQCQYTTAADKKPCPSKSSLELGCCLNTKGRLAGYCVGWWSPAGYRWGDRESIFYMAELYFNPAVSEITGIDFSPLP